MLPLRSRSGNNRPHPDRVPGYQGALVPHTDGTPNLLPAVGCYRSALVEKTSRPVQWRQMGRDGLAIRIGLMEDLEGAQRMML